MQARPQSAFFGGPGRRSRAGNLVVALLTLEMLAGCGDSTEVRVRTGEGGLGDLDRLVCDVDFRLIDHVELRNVQYDVDYSAAPGYFVGAGKAVDCVALTPGTAINRSNQCAGENAVCESGPDRILRNAILGNLTFQGPTDLARCRFSATEELLADDLDVAVVDASDLNFQQVPIDEARVEVAAIDCSGSRGTPTTTMSTTTTVPACGEGDCAPGQSCVGGVCVSSNLYAIDFALDDAVAVGSLQLRVDYDCAPGAILGTRFETQCKPDVSLNVFASFNNVVAEQDACGIEAVHDTLHAALVGPTGFDGPTRLFTCTFESEGAVPVAGDFDISVVDASTPQVRPMPAPAVSVSAIRPVSR